MAFLFLLKQKKRENLGSKSRVFSPLPSYKLTWWREREKKKEDDGNYIQTLHFCGQRRKRGHVDGKEEEEEEDFRLSREKGSVNRQLIE